MTKSDSINAEIKVPPHSQVRAVVAGRRYKADVPYKGTLIKHYTDGTTGISSLSGVYQGMNVNEVHVTFRNETISG